MKAQKSTSVSSASQAFEPNKSGEPRPRVSNLRVCITAFSVASDIFDSYSDLGLIFSWYNSGDERLALLLFLVVILSNTWSVWVLHVNKFNLPLSIIFGSLGLATLITSWKAFKIRNFHAPFFRKIKYYHALFESLPCGAILLFYIYTNEISFFGTFAGYKFLFSSYCVAWSGKNYILDNSYFGKSIVESQLEISIILKFLLVFILFSDYFARTLSLIIVLGLKEFKNMRPFIFAATFIIGFVIEWVFVRLLMIQIGRYARKNTQSSKSTSSASNPSSGSPKTMAPQISSFGVTVHSVHSSSPKGGKSKNVAKFGPVNSNSVTKGKKNNSNHKQNKATAKKKGKSSKNVKNTKNTQNSENIQKTKAGSIDLALQEQTQSRLKGKLCDDKGCLSNRRALFFSWIQLLSGMFTYHAIFICATMEENQGRCNKNKCCKYISWIAFCEIALRLSFPFLIVYGINGRLSVDSESNTTDDWINYTALSFMVLCAVGLVFGFSVCWIPQPLKRRG